MNNEPRLNVFAFNHSDFDNFLIKTHQKRSDVYRVERAQNLYGMWQGVLTVLPRALERDDFRQITDEARRRGLTIDILEE